MLSDNYRKEKQRIEMGREKRENEEAACSAVAVRTLDARRPRAAGYKWGSRKNAEDEHLG